MLKSTWRLVPLTLLVVSVTTFMAMSAIALPVRAQQSEPTITQIMAQGEEVPFEICGQATTWVRPSEEEQRAKWWTFGRYAGGDEKVIKHPWTHNFFVTYGSASTEYDITNLSGLWTLPGGVRAPCFEAERHDAILKLQTAEIWVLLHKVKRIKRLDTHYAVVVEPTEKGVQFVQFPRPERHLPLTLYFVTEDGQELDKIIEAETWPYPQLVPTPQPETLPVTGASAKWPVSGPSALLLAGVAAGVIGLALIKLWRRSNNYEV